MALALPVRLRQIHYCAKLIAFFAIGTRLQDFTTLSKFNFIGNDTPLIQLNVSRFDGNKMDALCLTADAKEGLNALQKTLTNKTN